MFNNTLKGSNMVNTILRLPDVKDKTGLSRSTIYLHIHQGLWPKQIKIGARSIGWPSSEIAAMNSARISGMPDDEIRALVTKLMLARKSLTQTN